MRNQDDELRKPGKPQLEPTLAFVDQPRLEPEVQGVSALSAAKWSGTGQRFRVLRPHARGGLGEVFVAQDLELQREVALKEIQSQFADRPESRSRFVLEAEITGGLEHPGIVPVYGLGQYDDGRPYYAMRFIRGNSLREAIERFHERDVPDRKPGERTLELRKLLGRFVDVCEAMEYAHSRGVLHRDLKPGNIMLGKYGETLVVDWGLAKVAGRDSAIDPEAVETNLAPASGSNSEPTAMGAALGTPAYMSPEQAAGRIDLLGRASDIYGLGATLYHLLTGQAPLRGCAPEEVLRRVRRGEIPSARMCNSRVPTPLSAICRKAMALQPEDRYASPRLLADDIEHWLADEPVSCLTEPLVIRARRWMKRHRTIVASTAAALAMFVTSLVVLLVMVTIHNRELDAKNRQLDDANTQLAQSNLDLGTANRAERAAKEEADKRRIDAEKARGETKQVLDYLVASFRKSDPKADGETLTVAAMLDQAVEQLDATFPNQPPIQAQMLNAIGETYRGLGLYAKSIAAHERIKALQINKSGEYDEGELTLVNNLAMSYQAIGRHTEALALLEQTLERSRAKLGAEHPYTLTVMNNVAEEYRAIGRFTEAVTLHAQTLELRNAKLGADHQDTLQSMNNLALTYHDLGQLADALPLLETTLELRKATLGSNHPLTLSSMNNLAEAYRSDDRLVEMLPLLEQMLVLRQARQGSEHPDTLLAMNNLGMAYHDVGRLEDALPLMEQTVQLMKSKLGLRHPHTLTAMNNLATVYQSAGRHAEAFPLFEQSLELMQTSLGPEHPFTLRVMHSLAMAYLEGDQPEKALPLFDRNIAGWRKRLANNETSFAGWLALVSDDLLKYRQHQAAETYLRECLAIRERTQPDVWTTFNSKSQLGGALLGQKKYAEVEPLLVAGYEGMKQREATIPEQAKIRLPEALDRLIELYTATDKPEEVNKWQAEQAKYAPPAASATENK